MIYIKCFFDRQVGGSVGVDPENFTSLSRPTPVSHSPKLSLRITVAHHQSLISSARKIVCVLRSRCRDNRHAFADDRNRGSAYRGYCRIAARKSYWPTSGRRY